MKKLLSLLFILPLFFSCSSDEETIDPDLLPNGETKIVFSHDFDTELYDIRISPYFPEEDFLDFYYVARIEKLGKNTNSKEFSITGDLDTEKGRKYYIFFNHETDETKAYKINRAFEINKGKLNTFTISKNEQKSIVVKLSYDYPVRGDKENTQESR